MLSPRAPPGKKWSGEQCQISWAYSLKVVRTNEIARLVIIKVFISTRVSIPFFEQVWCHTTAFALSPVLSLQSMSSEQCQISWAYSPQSGKDQWDCKIITYHFLYNCKILLSPLENWYLFLSGFATKCFEHLLAVVRACASPRNSTWFIRPFIFVRGLGLGMRLGPLCEWKEGVCMFVSLELRPKMRGGLGSRLCVCVPHGVWEGVIRVRMWCSKLIVLKVISHSNHVYTLT